MTPRPADTSPSVAPTLAWFAGLLVAALVALRGWPEGVAGMRGLIHGDDAGDLGPRQAGPAFVHAEDEGAEDLGELEAYAREDVAPVETTAAPAPAAAPAAPAAAPPALTTDDDDGDHDATTARTGIEDVCVDGTPDACRRWAMDAAYDALAAARAGRGLARLSLYGDSVTAEGYIASGMRSRMIRKYGDGGAGFVFLAKPSSWYQNLAVRHEAAGWTIHSVVANPAPDHLHGYGGATFSGTAGATATFRTAKAGAGSKVSRFELYYLAEPRGGTATISVDGEVATTVDTRADAAGSGFAALDLADGAHTITVRVTSGRVRGFGVTLERAAGVVVDSLGIVSQTTKNMGNNDAAHYAEQIARRDPALVMILLGANESAWLDGKSAKRQFRGHWDKVLGRIRKGHPGASCLVIGTLDAGKLVDGKKFEGRAAISWMIDVERAAAHAAGCAFWDARAFMGGEGAARAWYKKRLMSGDFEHLTKKGGQVIGSGIVEALEAGYAHRRSR